MTKAGSLNVWYFDIVKRAGFPSVSAMLFTYSGGQTGDRPAIAATEAAMMSDFTSSNSFGYSDIRHLWGTTEANYGGTIADSDNNIVVRNSGYYKIEFWMSYGNGDGTFSIISITKYDNNCFRRFHLVYIHYSIDRRRYYAYFEVRRICSSGKYRRH